MTNKPKPTPQEIDHKKRRANLQALCNRVASQFSFKNIRVWDDVYKFTGRPTGSAGFEPHYPVEYPELKKFFLHLQTELDKTLAAEIASPAPTVVEPEIVEKPTPQQKVVQEAIKEVVDESGLGNTNDYGLIASPNEKAFLFWFQKKACKEMLDKIGNSVKALLLLASTGTGKTFMAGALCRRLVDMQFAKGKTFGHTKYLYVTRATIVEQTKRVFEKDFGLGIKDGVEILNIDQLRSRAGQMWIEEKIVVENGVEKTVWNWKPFLNPVVVLWDECQALKNEGSIQHEIAAAYNDIKSPTLQVFISATPFTRVSEAKCFAVATQKECGGRLGLGGGITINNELWPTYAGAISSPSAPDDYNEAAVERLTKDLEPYIVRVKGVRPQFEAHNKVQMITFTTPEERKYYEEAWERYLEEKAKLEKENESGTGGGDSHLQILVQFLKFRMAAEYCRRHHLAAAMHNAVKTGGKAAVCALNFKGTIIEVVKILVNDYGVSRDQISLVWGGGQTALTKKQKDKSIIMENIQKLKEAGLDMDKTLQALDLVDVDDRKLEELDPALRLGPQSKDERQREIDRFQSGRTLFCLYTFKSGGVGLSLHHTDELAKVKARRQKNGYAVIADIPSVPIRPRINFVAPTYSAIELVQGLGRCPRLTSLSDTEQILVFYAGTIEQEVAAIVSQKLRCLSRVVRAKESWQDVVIGGVSKDAHLDINNVPDDPEGGDVLEGGSDGEE